MALEIFQWIVVCYFLFVNGIYLILLFTSVPAILKEKKEIEAGYLDLLLKGEALPTLSIIVPVYNEAENIVFCLHTLLNLSYRYKKLIVVNDGSKDSTLEILKNAFRLARVHPAMTDSIPTAPIRGYYQSTEFSNLIVLDKENGGKADAVNAAINASESDFIIIIDADTLIDSVEMNRMLRYFLTKPEILAAGGTIRVANGCEIILRGLQKVHMPKSWLASIQVVEYLRSFLVGRIGWKPFGGPLVISGAFGLFNAEWIKKIRGLDREVVGEDMELAIRLKKALIDNGQDATIGYLPQPIAWTEVPENLKVLGKQRTRWHLGLIQALFVHRDLCFNPKYGWMGMLLYPYYLVGELFAPLMEAIGYLLILMTWVFVPDSSWFILFFLMITWGFVTAVNIYSVMLDQIAFEKYSTWREFFKLLVVSVLENFGYRQLTVWWRLKAFYKYIYHVTGWEVVAKIGIKKTGKERIR